MKAAAGTALWTAIFLFAPSPAVRAAALLFALLPLADRAYLALMKASVRVRRRDRVLRTYRNRRTDLELILENRAYLPLPGALLRDGGEHRRMVELRPRELRVADFSFVPRERGEFPLGPLTMEIRGIFGTENILLRFSEPGRLIVYPSPLPGAYGDPPGSPLGTLKSRRRMDEDITRFRSLRDYVPGDERRRINWKAAARTGKLLCNEYESSADAPLTIFLELSLRSYPLKNRHFLLERSVEYAAALVAAADAAGQAVGLVCSGFLPGAADTVAVNASSGAAGSLMDILARVTAAEDAGSAELFLSAAAALPYRSQTWYVGPDPGDLAPTLAAAVRGRGAGFRLHLTELSRERAARLADLGLEAAELGGDSYA